MTTPQGNVNDIQLGAGRLLIGTFGSPIPVDCTVPWDDNWLELGLTKEGSSFKADMTIEDTYVEEIMDPIRGITTKRLFSAVFALAEVTLTNLRRAMNGASIFTTTGSPAVTTFEPPGYGGETYMAIGWESTDNTERWVLKRCLQAGSVELSRRNKIADPTAIGMAWNAYGVNDGQPVRMISVAPRN